MNMSTKEQKQRQSVEMPCSDMPVSKEHLLRSIDVVVNFDRIYDMAEYLYCDDKANHTFAEIALTTANAR